MADPLSITMGVVGLIQASYAITKLLTDFIGAVKGAPTQATIAAGEINETRVILKQIQNFILGFETADRARTRLIQVDPLVDVISGCVTTFSEFEAALDKIMKSSKTLVGRARWAVWDEEKIKGFVGISGRIQIDSIADSIRNALSDSIERLNIAAEMFNTGALERSQLADSDSVASQETTRLHTDPRSDTSSIVTVLHNPQDPDSMPDMLFRFDFELDLRRSRPYRAISLEPTTSAISLAESNKRGWSTLTGYSLADVSHISVISLYIDLSDLYNPSHYESSGENVLSGPSTSAKDVALRPQVLRVTVKGSRLKSTWKSVLTIVQTNRQKIALEEMHGQGQQYFDLGNLVEAEGMWRRTLDGYEKLLGLEHKLTLHAAHDLGAVYEKQGKLVDAEAMLQRALAVREKTLGLNNASTFDTANNLGTVYAKQERLVDAEAMLQWALAGQEKTLGREHATTLLSVHNLGFVYNKQEKLVQAEDMLRRALAGREKVLGQEHESTLNTVIGLGQVYDKQEKYVEAEAMYRRALDGCQKVLRPGDDWTLHTGVINELATFYRKLGKIEQAEALEPARQT